MLLRRVGLTLIGAWAILSVACLGQFLYDVGRTGGDARGQEVRNELHVKLTWEVMILNFPLSFGVAAIPLPIGGGGGGPITEWCILSLIGFLQWAILVPALARGLRVWISWLRSRSAA
jgi:hypothetical protein